MKKMKYLSVIGCMIAAVSFTSCSEDDNNGTTPLNKEEIATCFKAVKGNYTGKLIYEAKNEKNPKDKLDTLDVKWSIATDSTLSIASFPSKLLANCISDATLKKALASAANQDIKCRIKFNKISPVRFLINPTPLEYALNYGGKDHKVKVTFYTNSTLSYGSQDMKKNTLQLQLVEGSFTVDGKETAKNTSAVPFVFISTKKE